MNIWSRGLGDLLSQEISTTDRCHPATLIQTKLSEEKFQLNYIVRATPTYYKIHDGKYYVFISLPVILQKDAAKIIQLIEKRAPISAFVNEIFNDLAKLTCRVS